MVGFEAKMYGNGKIVVPSKIRKQLNLNDGDFVRVKDIMKLALVEQKTPKKEEA